MKQRRQLVAANWKMNGSRAFNAEWISTFLPTATDSAAAADVIVCVPSIYLQRSAKSLRGSQVQIGAQDVSEFAEGPFTGEISAAMLADVGVQWVIVGHSERRIIFGEMDKHVAAKAKAALEKGLKVIVCVGETLEERKAGRTEEVICRQLQAVIDAVGVEALAAGGAVAYEPVWAIGSGVAAKPADAQAACAALRACANRTDWKNGAKLRIVYGGSINPLNAPELFAQPDVDGGLVGGASLAPGDFFKICSAVR